MKKGIYLITMLTLSGCFCEIVDASKVPSLFGNLSRRGQNLREIPESPNLLQRVTTESVSPTSPSGADGNLLKLGSEYCNLSSKLEQLSFDLKNKKIDPANADLGGLKNTLKNELGKIDVKKHKILCKENDSIEFYTYSPKTGGKHPLVIFLHGGNEKAHFALKSPFDSVNGMEDPSSGLISDREDITYTLLPMVFSLVSKGIAVATISFNDTNNIKADIAQQIIAASNLDFVDKSKVLFIGHSFGGYMLTHLLADRRTSSILNTRCTAGIVFYAPAGTEESFQGGVWHQEYKKPDGNFQENNFVLNEDDEDDERAMTMAEFPIRTAATMSNSNSSIFVETLSESLLSYKNPVYVMYGSGDMNVLKSQVDRFIEQLSEIYNGHVTSILYPCSTHHVHRIKYDFSSGGLAESFLKERNFNFEDVAKRTEKTRKQNYEKFIDDIVKIVNKAVTEAAPPVEDPEILRMQKYADFYYQFEAVAKMFNELYCIFVNKSTSYQSEQMVGEVTDPVLTALLTGPKMPEPSSEIPESLLTDVIVACNSVEQDALLSRIREKYEKKLRSRNYSTKQEKLKKYLSDGNSPLREAIMALNAVNASSSGSASSSSSVASSSSGASSPSIARRN